MSGEWRDGCEDAGGRPRGMEEYVIFLVFAICTIWSVIWVFVGFSCTRDRGQNVASVGQLRLMDVLHMRSVSEHSSLDHANSTDTAGENMSKK